MRNKAKCIIYLLLWVSGLYGSYYINMEAMYFIISALIFVLIYILSRFILIQVLEGEIQTN